MFARGVIVRSKFNIILSSFTNRIVLSLFVHVLLPIATFTGLYYPIPVKLNVSTTKKLIRLPSHVA